MLNMSFLNTLTLIFAVLKLTEVISWSWWIVFLPTIISISFGLILLMILMFIKTNSKNRKYKSFIR